MNHYEAAIGCLTEAEKRRETLNIILTERDYYDVVKLSASIVDLSLKSLLRFAGVEVDGQRNLLPLIEDSAGRIPNLDRRALTKMREIYRRILDKKRKARRPQPSTNGHARKKFSRDEAVRAIRWSEFMVETAQRVIKDHDE